MIAEDFTRGLAGLEAFVAAHGHTRVPAAYRAQDGLALGLWMSNRRQDAKKGRLTGGQVTALNGLGFAWDPRSEDFARGLAELRAFTAEHGHGRVPAKYRTHDGYALGAWVGSWRQKRKAGQLTEEQIAALDGVGFVWDPYGEDFARGLAPLKAFVAEHGHARVPQTHRTGDELLLGAWVHRWRQERQAGRLTVERIAALDALGFTWS